MAGESIGELLLVVEVGVARLRRDGETRRHRNTNPRHVTQIGTLATKQSSNLVPVAVEGCLSLIDLLEPVDPLLHCVLLLCIR